MSPSDHIDESAVEQALVAELAKLGWAQRAAGDLGRENDDAIVESALREALVRLNPLVAEDPSRAEEVIRSIRAVVLAVSDDGLVVANREMVSWMCGRRTMKLLGTDRYEPVRLLDFDDPSRNEFWVTRQVAYKAGKVEKCFDVVLWANGLPLVVGEAKTPVSSSLSWLDAAIDIADTYEPQVPGFFVPNALCFATEGKELRYGAVGQPPELWVPWSRTTEPLPLPGMASVLHSARLLLAPANVLELLRSYTLFGRRPASAHSVDYKVVGRYQQVEAVEAIVERVRDPRRRKGLVWHHQGSGKTLTMAFAAAKIRRLADLDAPTILVVLDRLDLLEQLRLEFASVGVEPLKLAETKDELRRLLRDDDARGVIVTTIFRFHSAGLLNERDNIVVMVDEAHRTQEGRLGADMRAALPNARFIGLTGTPISDQDHNTWELFGDPDDPGGVLNHYPVERSIADGTTVPIHIETRLVDFHVDAESLDEAFAELAESENLDEEEQGILIKKGTKLAQVVKAPARVKAICEDIVAHYRAKVAPLGMKAQVVVADRECCVLYYEAINKLLGEGEEATVVMTTAKGDPPEWKVWDRPRDAENKVKARFLDPDDPLRFVIVTAKWLTGFDAPIEGVMYLDKALRAHTLFQAVCRTNRRWTNPKTGQEKLYGLIVDYVGLGTELAKAVAISDSGPRKPEPVETDKLVETFASALRACMARFSDVDRTATGYEQLTAAQQRLAAPADRDEFAKEFLHLEGLFEFLWPETALQSYEEDYKWLASIYRSVTPVEGAGRLLWHRLGAKTTQLVHEHISEVTIDTRGLERVAIDAGTFEALRNLGLWPTASPPSAPPTADEVLATIKDRLRAKLAGPRGSHPVWRSIAERLEALRRTTIDSAVASVNFLKELLEIAKDLVAAEKADAEGRLDEIKVVDPHRGALTQILEHYKPPDTPVIVENVVEQIDAIVKPVRGTGWQTSHPGDREVRRQLRLVLKNNGLPPDGELFDRAYAYIKENY